MILIADSGSTKTDWCLIDDYGMRRRISTQGINPFYQSDDEIGHILNEELLPSMDAEAGSIDSVLLCLLMLLSSCTFFDLYKMKLKKIYQADSEADDTKPLLHADAVELGGNVIRRSNRLFYLRENPGTGIVHRVYDIVSNRVVYTFTDTATAAVTNVQFYAVGL